MKSVKCFRLIAIENGKIKTLFHGVNGSRIIPQDTWMIAQKKIVSDGGTKYVSGFHVLKTRAECEKYLNKFTRKNIYVVSILAQNLRPKLHSSSPVFLAERIKLTKKTIDSLTSVVYY
jgi:hypothetical protein